jgi:hypothetical protein
MSTEREQLLAEWQALTLRLKAAETVVDAARELIDWNGVESHTTNLAAALFAYDELA